MVRIDVHNDTQSSSGSLEESNLHLNASYLFLLLNIYMLETYLSVSEVSFLPKFQDCFQVPLLTPVLWRVCSFPYLCNYLLLFRCLWHAPSALESLLPSSFPLGNGILILHDAWPEPLAALGLLSFLMPCPRQQRGPLAVFSQLSPHTANLVSPFYIFRGLDLITCPQRDPWLPFSSLIVTGLEQCSISSSHLASAVVVYCCNQYNSWVWLQLVRACTAS